jgi:membrane protein YdbS with pleckstrin-like domain
MGKMEFGVSPNLKKLYVTYLELSIFVGFVWWLVPFVVFAGVLITPFAGIVAALSGFVPLLIVAAVALYWIPRFADSVNYVLEEEEIVVTKGVVPYKRITNVNTYQ